MLEPVLNERHRLSDLALMGDPGFGRPWRLLHRYPLAEPAEESGPPSLPWLGRTAPPPVDALLGSVQELGRVTETKTPTIDTVLGLVRLRARVAGLYG